MTRRMSAALLEAWNEPLVIVDDVDIADPKTNEVLIEIAHCGLCHSDVGVMTGESPIPPPIILGHEACGTVVDVGPGVTAVAPGQRVMIAPIPACGRCYFCVRGDFTLCEEGMTLVTSTMVDGTVRTTRNGTDVSQGLSVGGFAEYAVVSANAVVPIPDDVDLEVVSVIGCAVQTGVGAALNTAKVDTGDTVLVMGLGGIGIAVVQGARLGGASKIIVSDPVAERRDRAEHFGATHAIDPTSQDVVAEVQKLTGGIGVDHAFDAAGHTAVFEAGYQAIRRGGLVVAIGAGAITDMVSVSRLDLMMSGKRLSGCLLGSVNPRRDIPAYIDLYKAGRLDLEAMVTHRRPLSEINEAVADMHAGIGLRTVLTP